MQKEWIVEMIEMKNFHVHLPNRQDGILGFTGEHQSRRLVIHLDEPGTWNYKLELAYEDGQKNILDLTTDENQLYVDLERAHLAQGGTVQAQIRGIRGEEICKSNVFSLQILPSIEASKAFSAVLPSEFEQIEQRITVLSQEVQESADIAEEAVATAQTLILHSPIIQNGTWWVYDAEKAGYQDTGTQATGARGEIGKTGAQGAKGEKGEPGTNFVVLGQYATLDTLQAAISNPQPGWAYAVGTTTPYAIYIYSETGTWVNHGTLQGTDATINGVSTLTIAAGDKIALEQKGSTLTIRTDGVAPAPLTGNRILYVSESGNDTTGTGSSSNPFRQIQTALDHIPKELDGKKVTINVGEGDFDSFNITGFSNGGINFEGSKRDKELLSCICGGIKVYQNSAVVRLNNLHLSDGFKYGDHFVVVRFLNTPGCITNSKIDGSHTLGVIAETTSIYLAGVEISGATIGAVKAINAMVEAHVMSGTDNACAFISGDASAGAGGLILSGGTIPTATTSYSTATSGCIIRNKEFM